MNPKINQLSLKCMPQRVVSAPYCNDGMKARHTLPPSLISDPCDRNVPTKNKLNPHATLRQIKPNKVTVFLARRSVHSHPCFSELILGKKSDLFNDCSPAGQTLFLQEDSDVWPCVRFKSTNYWIIHRTKTKAAEDTSKPLFEIIA